MKNLKHTKLWALAALVLSFGFTSCDDEEEWNTTGNGKVEMVSSSRAFLLNEGSFGLNNSNIVYFDWANDNVKPVNIFKEQNGKNLGDTGNDIVVIDNNKLAVAVNVSNYVALLDGYGIEQSRISFEQYKNLGQVRNLDVAGGTIYAVSNGGYVSRIRINGNKLEYVDSLKVGAHPEDLLMKNGKLYVTVQGENYDSNRLAVINNDFKTVSYSTIMQNPTHLHDADDKICVLGNGAMWDNPWGVFDPATGKYTEKGNASCMCVINGKAYISHSITNYTTYSTETKLGEYDLKSGTKNDKFFKNVPEEVSKSVVCSVSVNPYNGNIYLGTTDYKTDGTIYVFDGQGNFKRKFSAGGVNPNKIAFLK